MRNLSSLVALVVLGSACGNDPVAPNPVATTIDVSPARAALLFLGETIQLTARVRDQSGQVMSGAAVSWSSSNAGVATVEASGLVRSVADGTTTVTAQSGSASGTAQVTVRPDRIGLAALYDAAGGDGWTRNDKWLTEAPVGEWAGVTTNGEGRVVRLDLSQNRLRGSIPAELQNLESLEWLFLDGNQLTGSIPPELADLGSLQGLVLGGNRLTGPIPRELANLESLVWLLLDGNELTGSISPELGSFRSLTALGLHGNQLTGSIPPELGSLRYLRMLGLGGNRLTGPIPPELANLDALTRLSLHSNQLSGSIPAKLGNLVRLRTLELGDNRLSGPIPHELSNLVGILDRLVLDSNQLTGSIPAWLGELEFSDQLYLRHNFLSGCIPASVASLEDPRVNPQGDAADPSSEYDLPACSSGG